MTKFLTAIALTIAIPAVAHAQAAPAPAPAEAKRGSCADMKPMMDCCKDMGGDKSHAGHDMTPSGEANQQHQ